MLSCCGPRRQTFIFFTVFTLALFILFYNHNDFPDRVPQLLGPEPPPKPSERLTIQATTLDELAKVHLLLPAASGRTSLCKTLLTAAVLDYPVPTLISWDQTFKDDHLIGGGRHVAKIEKIYEWLQAQPDSRKDDLVIVVDAYGGFNYHTDRESIDAHLDGDVWFQLPLEVLVQRYHAVNDMANRDLKERLGEAYEREGIKQTILFGATKQCTPSDAASSACYPVPESPLPPYLYGEYTDDMNLNHNAHRTRYLSSAYILGPVRDMRAMFRRASEKAARAARSPTGPAEAELGFDAALDLGSDQAIFSHMFGEQEYQREVLRRGYGEAARGPTVVEGTVIDDVLDPGIPHEEVPQHEKQEGDNPFEFGIGLDYWSDLGMQTALSEDDARWLTYRDPISPQMLTRHRQHWNCPPEVEGALPEEVLGSSNLPRAAASDSSAFSPQHGWDEIPLYTNICLDTIPVIVNHNGNKEQRERDWSEMWPQLHGRQLIEEILDREEGDIEGEYRGGAYDGLGGQYMKWGQLCPASVERELYRDT
ncbi:hypothetical protein ACRE_034850 [Hapsidospora chrysogenum ATCC 11550]|uniref:Uncharacterized protein n=1 Tax=Hapsidospora chrysogenum (strain ATCC 11550 / CBS 779.69 / DSM 880 / IAM 14645 / JCM 23072 / IMI 49137) TaxID=857340 RepID=A0A086T8L0_HAPC1|nr:hypothetical protein ACRE_034850 [Hapsidospora chrysogenum ATCC 11550]